MMIAEHHLLFSFPCEGDRLEKFLLDKFVNMFNDHNIFTILIFVDIVTDDEFIIP